MNRENQRLISIFIYTISEKGFPCIVSLLNPVSERDFHIHKTANHRIMSIVACIFPPASCLISTHVNSNVKEKDFVDKKIPHKREEGR